MADKIGDELLHFVLAELTVLVRCRADQDFQVRPAAERRSALSQPAKVQSHRNTVSSLSPQKS